MTDAELERLLALDAGPGPALAIDAARTDAMIEAALAGAGFGPVGGGGGAGTGSGGMAAGAKLAIVTGLCGVVIAIALLAGRDRHRGDERAAVPVADAAIIDDNGGGATVATPTPDALVEPTDDDDIIDMSTLPPSPRTKPARDPAVDLLGEANAKRAAKQWRESDALYARVVERAPKSLAAQTALVASASLHLEHLGDPKGATQRYRRALALAPSGALAEEARWGLVEAAHANRDRAAEAAALDDFLAHHASSPLASRAKVRRAELP